jgi:hypothetical protein
LIFHYGLLTGAPLDVVETMYRYSTDVTASCAFGINANSLKDRNAEFMMYARKMFEFSVWKELAALTAFTAPEVKNLLHIKFLDDDSQIPEEDGLEYSGIQVRNIYILRCHINARSKILCKTKCSFS